MTHHPATDPNCPALLVVGHGTNSPRGQAEHRELVALIAHRLPQTIVVDGFLEVVEPTVGCALSDLTRRGARHVVIVPLLLFEAGHAKRDVPRQARQAAEKHGLRVHVTPALKHHPHLVALSARRFEDAVHLANCDPRDVAWLLVGRGSRDAQATTQFHEFLGHRRAVTPVGDARGAFLAMARPRVADIVQELVGSPREWVVVQPHLLFVGELLERLERIVKKQDECSGRQRWLMTEHLGSHDLVAQAVVDRFHQGAGVWDFNANSYGDNRHESARGT